MKTHCNIWKKRDKNIYEKYIDVIEFNYKADIQWKVWLLYFEGC